MNLAGCHSPSSRATTSDRELSSDMHKSRKRGNILKLSPLSNPTTYELWGFIYYCIILFMRPFMRPFIHGLTYIGPFIYEPIYEPAAEHSLAWRVQQDHLPLLWLVGVMVRGEVHSLLILCWHKASCSSFTFLSSLLHCCSRLFFWGLLRFSSRESLRAAS